MTLAGHIRARWYAESVERQGRHYAANWDETARLAAQLAAWNVEWQRLIETVKYYRDLYRQGEVPAQFSSWEEYVGVVPVTTRSTVQEWKREMADERRRPDFYRITGGSTAEPVQLPAWNSENRLNLVDMWLGRSWYAITPASRLFLLWGHSHLLGSGLQGWLNRQQRRLSDRLLGYHRFSAYDLRPGTMRNAAEVLLRFRPEYIIGYSVALDLFARANLNRRDALRGLGLKVIVGAAESFPAGNSVEMLQDLFSCPVAMEYGSVETALMAHTHPRGGYSVFWKTYFLEAERASGSVAAWKVRVTSLYPRCFPLVRYEMGDDIELAGTAARHVLGVASFNRVIGRCNDFVTMKDGAVIHSEAFTHAVRSCPKIRSYQVVDSGERLGLNFTCEELLSPTELDAILDRLVKIHPELAEVKLERVAELRRTLAGKTRMVVRVHSAGDAEGGC